MEKRKKYLPMGDRTEREEFKMRDREQDRDGERNRLATYYTAKKEDLKQQGQGARQRGTETAKIPMGYRQRERNAKTVARSQTEKEKIATGYRAERGRT